MDDLQTWDVIVGRVVGRWDHASFKIAPHEASPDRFKAGSQLCCVAKDGSRCLLHVRAARRQGKHWVCDCGLTTLETAERLVGSTLWIHRSMRPALAPGEFYLDEVLGLRVVTEGGEDWGEIEEILDTAAHPVYVTPTAMIPAHREFIVDTNWETKVLTVRDVPGLKKL